MPYQKRYNKYKRPGYKACGRMVYGDAKKALVIAKGVRRLLNVEVKNFDTQATLAVINTTPIITQLTNIDRGDTTNSRDGSQCKMVGIEFHYSCLVNASAASRTQIRVMLVVDKQTNQAVYVINDLIADITASDNVISPRNLDNKHRFSILYDRTHVLSAASPSVIVRKYIKKDLLLRYDDTGNGIADLTQNSLSLVRMSNEATNTPAISHFMRVRFVDN